MSTSDQKSTSDQNQQWAAAYLDFLHSIRRLASLTLAAYQRDVQFLLTHCDDCPLVHLQAAQLRTALTALHAGVTSPAHPRSVARALSAWRGLFRWLRMQQHMTHDPMLGLRAPRAPRLLPKALSPDAAGHYVALTGISADAAVQQWLLVRDRALLELMYSCGLRLSELIGLDWRYNESPEHRSHSWWDRESADLNVRGKGQKSRQVPVGKVAQTALESWLTLRLALANRENVAKADAAGTDHYALFISQQGRRLSARAVQYRFAKWAQVLGLPVAVHPHVLRHSFASHMLQSSGDLRAVQELLGHASIATTQIYTHLDFQHVTAVYDAAHPRARRR